MIKNNNIVPNSSLANKVKKPYNSYADYFRERYGERVQKLTIDAGFTCPNRDGTLAKGGCVYCNNKAFNPSYCTPIKSITQQLQEGIEFHKTRYRKAAQYLAYFQAYSNTYAPLDVLKARYEEALAHPDVIGLVIGTRPDCINTETLDYLQELNTQYPITIEYGLETTDEFALSKLNRCHTAQQAYEAIHKTAERGIHVGTHLIIGLPHMTKNQMLEQIHIINSLPIHTLKLHQLQITKDTAFEKMYLSNPDLFPLFQRDEYIQFTAQFLERLRPDIILERFFSEMPPRFQILPSWNIRTTEMWQLLEKHLLQQNTYQGRLYDASLNIPY